MTIDFSLSTSRLNMRRGVISGLVDTPVHFHIKVKMRQLLYAENLTCVEYIIRILVSNASLG